MTVTTEATPDAAPGAEVCPPWCAGCWPDLGPHASQCEEIELTLEEPGTCTDFTTHRQCWQTRKIGVMVFAEQGSSFPYLSLAVSEAADQEVKMTFGEALDLIAALTSATDKVAATVHAAAGRVAS